MKAALRYVAYVFCIVGCMSGTAWGKASIEEVMANCTRDICTFVQKRSETLPRSFDENLKALKAKIERGSDKNHGHHDLAAAIVSLMELIQNDAASVIAAMPENEEPLVDELAKRKGNACKALTPAYAQAIEQKTKQHKRELKQRARLEKSLLPKLPYPVNPLAWNYKDDCEEDKGSAIRNRVKVGVSILSLVLLVDLLARRKNSLLFTFMRKCKERAIKVWNWIRGKKGEISEEEALACEQELLALSSHDSAAEQLHDQVVIDEEPGTEAN